MKKINTIYLFPYFQMHRNDRRDLKVIAPLKGKKKNNTIITKYSRIRRKNAKQ